MCLGHALEWPMGHCGLNGAMVSLVSIATKMPLERSQSSIPWLAIPSSLRGVELTANIYITSRLKCADQCLHSHEHLHGVVLNLEQGQLCLLSPPC
jgi:hypothetical protein